VGETYFFRDRACFDALRQHVLPALIAARRAEGTLRLRLWSAGCATGEEPYSLAILLDSLLPDRPDWAVTILATDINAAALEVARRGLYREWSFRQSPPEIRGRHFRDRGDETFELNPSIRRMVAFAPLNLAAGVYPDVVTNTTAMDLVVCRNVLMYFTPEAQRAAMARLRRALVSGGWLVVSPVEASAEMLRPLLPVNLTGAILYRKEPALDSRPSPEPEMALPDRPAPAPICCAPDEMAPPPPAGPPHEEACAAPAEATALERARALADQGNLDEARRLCEAALERDRLDPQPQLLLAAICQERAEIPAALEALRRALYLAPDAAVAHFMLGGLLLRQDQRGRGRRCMETVVALLTSAPRDEPVPGCLFAGAGTDLREPLRGGCDDGVLAGLIGEFWSRRQDRYSEIRFAGGVRAPRAEMSYLGG
jgi:chemotaxis protein methyltransferase CheR